MDNPQPDEGISNPVAHVHHYAIKGGPTFWAQCACGEKMTTGNGAIVGSRTKVEAAIALEESRG